MVEIIRPAFLSGSIRHAWVVHEILDLRSDENGVGNDSDSEKYLEGPQASATCVLPARETGALCRMVVKLLGLESLGHFC